MNKLNKNSLKRKYTNLIKLKLKVKLIHKRRLKYLKNSIKILNNKFRFQKHPRKDKEKDC